MDKKDILNNIDHNEGMTVPEGYFDNFARQMSAALPEQPWEREVPKPRIAPQRSTWHRIRPYVYLAAMFAGIWLMMNMFTIFQPPTLEQRFAKNEVLQEAVTDSTFIAEQDIDLEGDFDIEEAMDQLYAEGITADDLRRQLNML